MLRRTDECEGGFTLIELLVAVTILGIVGSITMGGLITAFGATTHAEARIQAVTQLHTSMATVTRSIRSADSRDSDPDGRAALLRATPREVRLDRFLGMQRHRLTYTVTADGLLREDRQIWNDRTALTSTPPNSTGTRVVARNLTGFTGGRAIPVFSYLGPGGGCVRDPCPLDPTAALTAAELGEVSEVVVALRRQVDQERPFIEVTTRVTLRNRAR